MGSQSQITWVYEPESGQSWGIDQRAVSCVSGGVFGWKWDGKEYCEGGRGKVWGGKVSCGVPGGGLESGRVI